MAAPFSVVPSTIARHLSWNQLARTLTNPRTGTAAPLVWQGIPCKLGTITLHWVHLATGIRSRPLTTVAKFPERPAIPTLERSIVLGLALFDDNNIQLLLDRRGGMLAGRVVTP
jgi:hypothetical protein